MSRLVYLVSQFPELHETFILRELLALRDAGVPVHIYSLKRCRDRIVHAEARPLLSQTTYLPIDAPATWAAWAVELVRHPVQAAASLAWTLRHHAWPPVTLFKAAAVWVQSLALTRRLRREGATHLHAHWATMPTTAAVLIARRLRIPFSFTAHAWDLFVPNPSLGEKIRRAAQVYICTAYNRQWLLERHPAAAEKILLNYHGVNLDRFQPTARRSGEPLLVSVGRLVETKGFADLLEAYRLLRQRGVAFRAVIVGEGPLRASLEQQRRAHGLSEIVELRGAIRQEELRALYAQAAGFVMPSVIARNGDRDGIPNVMLEAMAMGLPVIATNVSGLPEAVQEGRTGWLVEPRHPEGLAQACESLLRQPEQAAAFGAAGRRLVEARFDQRSHLQVFTRQMQERLGGVRPKVKLLFVIWSMAIGGAERVIALLARHLDRSRYEPMIACLNEPGAFAAELEAEGIRVIALHKLGWFDIRVLWRLMRLIRRERIALVHTHLWGGNFWGRLAAVLTGTPCVTTEHNTDYWKRRWQLSMDRWLAARTHRIVMVSRAVQQFYTARGLPADRMETILNGIETQRFAQAEPSALYAQLGWNAQTPVFLSLGRLVWAKRLEAFVEGMAQLLSRCPQARALIVGEGPLRENLQRQIAERGLEGKVVLAGVRSDIPQLLAGARALVLTSRREGLPMVLLEAMAAGVPAVAAAVGGIPEVIEEGRTGWLVPPNDQAVLVDRLAMLAQDPAAARQAGAAAQTAVRARWSVEEMVRRHDTLYQRVLRRPLRVAYVIDDVGIGGAQRQLLELARHLPAGECEATVIALSTVKQELAGSFRDAGVPLVLIPQSGKWSWRCLLTLYRTLTRIHPDVVHTWLFTADLYGRLAAWMTGVPVIMSAIRSVDPGKPPHYVAMDRFLRRLTHGFTVNAGIIGDVLRQREGVPPSMVHTVYNGVDLRRFHPATVNGEVRQRLGLRDHAGRIIGIIGRLSPEKDHATFLQAAELVCRRQPDAAFLIVGEGPLRAELEHLAGRLKLASQVSFVPNQADMEEIFAALDVLVVSSHYEGCSNVILEAMAMRKPVVATAVGGNPELVIDGETGFLVPARSPEPLAEAILEVLGDPARARTLGEAGRRRVEERFSMERSVTDTLELYARLLRSSQDA